MMGFGMMGGGLLGLVLLGILIYFIVGQINNNSLSNKRKDPLEILKERYARGEISEQEYEEKRRFLNK